MRVNSYFGSVKLSSEEVNLSFELEMVLRVSLKAQTSADFILISSWPPGVVSDYLLKVVRRSFGKS